jgi:excisionase family DNA binding protein
VTAVPRPAGRLLSAAEVGALFGVAPETVRRWERAGKLSALRDGRARRYREHDIRALLAGTP